MLKREVPVYMLASEMLLGSLRTPVPLLAEKHLFFGVTDRTALISPNIDYNTSFPLK